MENASFSSYPDSGDSSPRSREIDDTQSWDEPPSSYKVKFMCSYGGKIQPRPHDNQLAYIGGDTKILSVDRSINFSVMMGKLASLCGDSDICFKYQLPGEDLDALISVANDEDLEHMMLEYDRLHRGSAKPARLRLFLFQLNPLSSGSKSNEVKSERQWFVDALNSVQVQTLDVSSPPAPAGTPDYLFGLEKGFPVVSAAKFIDTASAAPTVPEVVAKDVSAGSEDRHVFGEPVMNQRIQDLQRLQIAASHEQAILSRKIEEAKAEYYHQEKNFPATAPPPVQMPIPTAFLPERHMTSTGYPVAAGRSDQPIYMIPPAANVYPAPTMRSVTGQGPGYYGMPRVVQEVYQEQPVYNPMPQPNATVSIQQQQQQQQPPKVGVYGEGGGIGMVQQQPPQGYVHVGYDSSGRQMYYTTPFPAAAVDGGQGGGAVNQDGKIVAANVMAPQTSTI